MFSLFKKILHTSKKPVNNENGNILAIALIIVTVLAFSVSTIAGMSVNLVNDTTEEMENLNDESEAKAKIKLAISFFQGWVQDPINLQDFDTFDGLYTNNPDDIYGVTITNITNEYPDIPPSSTAKVYKFAVPLIDGRTLSMKEFVSDVGVETTQFEPFEYTIGTSGDLILNSGIYGSDTGVPIKLFGDNIYFGRRAPFIVNGTLNDQELTSNTISNDAILTYPEAAEVHYNSSLTYCGGSTCYDINDVGDPISIVKDQFADFTDTVPADQGTTGSVIITDFFGDFNYNDYIINFIENDAASRFRTLNADWSTLAEDIYNNSSPLIVEARYHPKWGYLMGYNYTWPTDDFVDITENVGAVDFKRDFQDEDSSFVYFGNDDGTYFPYNSSLVPTSTTTPLHLDGDITIGVEESLIVFGDLYLDQTWGTQDILGEIVVTGNLYIQGCDKDWEGSVMVFGETFIELDDNEQFRTNGMNSGITFMCKDNIHFISHDENHNSSVQSDIFYMFIYTEESIFIDAVNSRYYYSGVMFARAAGVSGNNIFMDDGVDPIRGIVVNSFYGYVDNSGNFHDGTGLSSYRFNIDVMSSTWYADRFENLPAFPSEVIVSTGDLNFYEEEFVIE